jgi:hypothetical protein
MQGDRGNLMIVEVAEFAKKSAGNSLSSRFVSDDRFCAFFHNIDFNSEDFR